MDYKKNFWEDVWFRAVRDIVEQPSEMPNWMKETLVQLTEAYYLFLKQNPIERRLVEMCMIIGWKATVEESISFIEENLSILEDELNKKGGDGYSISFLGTFEAITRQVGKTFRDAWEKFKREHGNKLLSHYREPAFIVLFSRQKPEMETETTEDTIPPFFGEEGDNDNYLTKYIWVHGTVANEEELKKEFNLDRYPIKVDSQIFCHIPTYEYNKVKGWVTVVQFDEDSQSVGFTFPRMDLGLWEHRVGKFNLFSTSPVFHKSYGTPLDVDKSTWKLSVNDVEPYRTPNVLYVAYSGGMDATFSTYYVIKRAEKYRHLKEVNLVYFDYGTKAREREIESLYKFTDYLKKEFPSIEINPRIVPTDKVFSHFTMLEGLGSLRLIEGVEDKEQEGRKESEANLAYVPLRNTLFVLMLKAMIEGRKDLEGKNAGIILGLNLTEGMVYGDNSEAWIWSINELIKYAGKEYQKVKVIAPFANDTKTRYLLKCKEELGEDKVKELLNVSFSCYYPDKNGNPCGKCGSCLLRQKAVEKLELK